MSKNRLVRGLMACAAMLALATSVAPIAGAQTLTPIAAIQANPASFESQTVTVEGNVTVPVNYRGPMFYSGYIQDGSGSGINIFGGASPVPNPAALNTLGNLVRVTGEVAIFSATTIELINVADVTLVGPGAAPPPIHLTAVAANDARWEGTLIEVAGSIVSSMATGTTARNYTISDGTGTIVARVYNTLGIPQIADGTAVIGRGAGTNFSGTFQFYVGQASDFVAGTPPSDTQPPRLVGAWGRTATQVRVTFDEAVDAATGAAAGNYEVFETSNPTSTVAVGSVALAGPVATLTLGGNLASATDYTLRVSNVRDLAMNPIASPISRIFAAPSVPTDTTPPTLVGAAATNLTSVLATFSEAIDAVTGGTAAHYTVFQTSNPSNTFTVSSATVSGLTANLTLGSSLTAGTNYTLRAQNVRDLAGNAMPAPQTVTFTTAGGGGITPIAEIQNNLRMYKGQTVTVQGQVYIKNNYRGTTRSGYIQDSSNRGINLFGAAPSGTDALLQDLGNIVTVTGTVDTFFTTIEILNMTNVTLASGGNPRLQPTTLSCAAAASSQWEGTYIEVTGPITAKARPGATPTATNYTVNDGTGNIVVRVVDALGVAEFNVGDSITGAGAGGQFQADFQVLVGNPDDVGLAGSDTTPPSLSSASATNLTTVRATFNEAIDPVTGGAAANYAVFETATPGNTVPVSSVAVSGSVATLTLGASLTAGRNYTLRAQSIADVAGNPMAAPQTVTFTPTGGGGITPIADIQNNLRMYKGQTVTVQGQVYIKNNYRGTTRSGYIQDSSNRGINLFGAAPSGADPLLQDLGNIVTVTGTVDTFFTTIEILNMTNVTLASGGNPRLQPTTLSCAAAASSQWEGTYIEVTGPITAKARPGATPTATNYTVNDGTGNIVVRIVDALGVAEFNVGDRITAAGAGSLFQTDYQVLVGNADDVGIASGGDTTPPSVTGATAPTLTSVEVTFSEAVTAVTGNSIGNYSVFETANPSTVVPVTAAAVAANRRTATLTLGSALTNGRSYSVRVSNLQDDAGNTMPAPQTVAFTPGSGPAITPIAAIHGNLRMYKGQTVTVRGQVYIPNNYRGTVRSGYIQDSSNRGINLFGNAPSGGDPLLQNLGNIVTVTGVVDTFFTTIEILNMTSVTLFSSGNPRLQPTPLRCADAASSAWEGTYIQVTGNITAKARPGATPTATNYTVDDGSGTPIIARVVDPLGIPEFNVGDLVTARGAGSLFQSDYQVLVGTQDGMFLGQPTDTFPPAVLSALATGAREVTVEFNEPVSPATALVPENYEVFRTNAPAEVIAVISVVASGNNKVVLQLGSDLDPALGYTVRVRNVADQLGNTIPAGGVTRAIVEAPAEAVGVSGPKNTFLPRLGEAYPITFTVPSDVATGNGEVLLRIFDLRGQLKRTLFDSRFDQNAFTNNRATRTWDGRDDVASLVPAGTYVVHLMVTPKRAGSERQLAQIPVVVATRLDR